MNKLVSIGTRKIPVIIGNGVTEMYFKAGVHGKREKGFYRFWTLIGLDDDGDFFIIGRARRSLDAGDRFARMSWERTAANPHSHRVIYRRLYKQAQRGALYIRPSTKRDLDRWIDSHQKDMAFAKRERLIQGRKR